MKVVAALALAVLALPPVVNAIMEKAAQQADASFLRDGDQPLPEGAPPPGAQPPPGSQQARAGSPPPPARPPAPKCTPVAGGEQRSIAPTDLGSQGAVSVTTRRGDLAVVLHIDGRGVTGQPSFALTEQGRTQWRHAETHVNEDLALPRADEGGGAYEAPVPGREWVATWDLAGVVHRGVSIALGTQRCAEAGP